MTKKTHRKKNTLLPLPDTPFGCGGSAKHGGGAQRNGGSAVAAAQRLRRWRQRDSAMSATAAPSANAPMHAPSNITDAPTYASLSLVEDGGTTVLTASSSATAAPVATSIVATAAQTKPKATLTIPFFKLNTLLN